jgi:hypothetical protein
MGQADLYPFVLTPAVVHKLDFVHRLVRQFGTLPSPEPLAPRERLVYT